MEKIIENLKDQARKSWDGKTGEERAENLEKYLREKLKHYSDILNVSQESILESWEEKRTYSAINYYQEANQPALDSNTTRVFENKKEALDSIGKKGFRCPYCKGISTNPYECNTGISITKDEKGKDVPCDWKIYGLFGDLGKGAYIYIRDILYGEHIFMPISWEDENGES